MPQAYVTLVQEYASLNASWHLFGFLKPQLLLPLLTIGLLADLHKAV